MWYRNWQFWSYPEKYSRSSLCTHTYYWSGCKAFPSNLSFRSGSFHVKSTQKNLEPIRFEWNLVCA